jgi:hypothetical protein
LPFDYLTRPIGCGSFAVPSDRKVIAPVLWSILEARLAFTLAAGDLLAYRWTRAMRCHLMSGMPIGNGSAAHAAALLHAGEATWAEFRVAYRLDGPLDDALGFSSLHYAVMSNNLAVAAELLALGADVHALTPAKGDPSMGSTGGDSILTTAMQTCGRHFPAAPMIDLLLAAVPTCASSRARRATACWSRQLSGCARARRVGERASKRERRAPRPRSRSPRRFAPRARARPRALARLAHHTHRPRPRALGVCPRRATAKRWRR